MLVLFLFVGILQKDMVDRRDLATIGLRIVESIASSQIAKSVTYAELSPVSGSARV